MKKNRLHSFLFSFLILLLITPLIAYQFSPKDKMPLKGAYVPVEKPEISFGSFFDASFQSDYEEYWNENFWLRSVLVRCYNQFQFSLYRKSSVPYVKVGRNDYLYETNYIDSYLGYDFVGEANWTNRVKTIQLVRDSLKNYNCDLLVVMATGKGFFYPEHIPGYYKHSGNSTNYEVLSKKLLSTNVPHIDFNKWFLENKSSSKYNLYPKTGIHWSYYGMTKVADSLIKYIEKMRNIDLAEMIVDSIELINGTEHSDADIEEAMNLLSDIPKPQMAYPRFHFNSEGKAKPRVIVIGDSFYWDMFGSGFSSNVFNDGKFWYYYNEVYPDYWGTPTKVTDRNLFDEIKKTDVVIVLCNDQNLRNIGWGFFKEAKNMFQHFDTWKREKRVSEIEKQMRENKNWFNLLLKKSLDSGVRFDSIMRKDAIYMYELELNAGQR